MSARSQFFSRSTRAARAFAGEPFRHARRAWDGFSARCRRYRRDESGSLLIFSLFLLVMILMIAGLAVDLMRAETHRARLQATLDRAVLAGASLDQTLNAIDVVQDYFDKAGLGQFVTSINVTETPTSKEVNATAQMVVNSYFMNMLGIDTVIAPAAGQAEESLTDIEISLIVDVSGSMGASAASGGTKIDVLKTAAKEFVYLMQCDPDAESPFDGNCVVEPNTVSINLVPYNQQVMLGEDLIEQFNVTMEHTNSSCVAMDPADYSTIPVALNPQVIDPAAPPDPTPDVKRATQLDFWSGYGGYWGKEARDRWRECAPNNGQDPWGRDYADRQVAVYQNDYNALWTRIDGLFSGGNTSIDLAMKWGAALLAPEFRPAVTNLANNYGLIDTAFIGRPFDYSRPRSRKVVVLMTDGMNTSKVWVEDRYRSGLSPFFVVRSNHSAIPPGGENPASDHISVYSQARDDAGLPPYRRIEHGDWSWTPDGGTGNAQRLEWPEVWERYHVITVADAMDDAGYSDDRWWEFVDYDYTSIKDARLQTICDEAKAAGMVIFTIGFETSVASNQVLANCASSPSHHYDVQGIDLTAAFNSIAREIHQLRLTN